MVCIQNQHQNMFAEAVAHSRWKNVLNTSLTIISRNLPQFQKMKTFEEVYQEVNRIFTNIHGIGTLATYDTSAAICKKFNIPINRVYIIGGGPRRAVQLLDIPTQIDTVLKIKYANREDVLKVFGKDNMSNDDLESNLCNWQKNV
jgi:hypothetical protein